jgi:hypothetical protein
MTGRPVQYNHFIFEIVQFWTAIDPRLADPSQVNNKEEASMANTIKAGSILITEGIFLPESLLFEREYCAHGWILVKNLDSYGMKQLVSKAGWSFLYMAGEFKARIFGSDEEKTRHKAIRQVLANMRSKKFNCMEITRIATKRFLGLPYVSVQARPRQIQESPALVGDFFED